MKTCKDCGKQIKGYYAKRCPSCASKGKNNAMFGKTGKECPSFTHGLTCIDKQYFCKICQTEITTKSAIYGLGMCNSCGHKGIRHEAWNKGIKNSTNRYWLGKSQTNIIINHHIYLKENSEETIKMPQGQHRSLHWNGYKYLVYLGIIKEYLKWFLKKYQDALTTPNVRHHIDCDRRNNNTDNFLYLASKAIHNKLHQEAYEYLVNVNKIKEYLEWFFLMEKKIPDEKTCKGGTIL